LFRITGGELQKQPTSDVECRKNRRPAIQAYKDFLAGGFGTDPDAFSVLDPADIKRLTKAGFIDTTRIGFGLYRCRLPAQSPGTVESPSQRVSWADAIKHADTIATDAMQRAIPVDTNIFFISDLPL